MRHLNGIYTQIFNKDQERDGALFRGRYKAILVEDETYLIKLSRYIHLNPVDAEICLNPEEYQWSSYQYYLKPHHAPSWLNLKIILNYFGEKNLFQEFTADGIDNETKSFFEKNKIPSVFGSKEFLKLINETFLKNKPENIDIPEQTFIRKSFLPTPPQIRDLFRIVQQHNIKNSNLIKSIVIYISIEFCQFSLKTLSSELGNASRSGLSTNYRRFLNKLEKKPELKKYILEIANSISRNMSNA